MKPDERPPKPPFRWPEAVPRDALANVYVVRGELDGMRLDRWLSLELPRLSRSRAQKICAEWAFDAAGRQLPPAHRVRAGSTVVVFRPLWDEPEVPLEVPLLYQDEYLVAVDKPAGLPVHPTACYHRHTLTHVLAQRFPGERVVLAHRLDRETSGVLLAARTARAERGLKKAFADRQVQKTYHAIVHGCVPDGLRCIDAPLALAGDEVGVRMCVRAEAAGGLPSRTRVEVLERLGGFTLVAARPETGRQHQIRVHLAHAGFPILGDKLYAHGNAVFLACLEGGLTDELRARLLLDRQALHAQRLQIAHPITGDPLDLTAPLPPDLQAFCAQHREPAPSDLFPGA